MQSDGRKRIGGRLVRLVILAGVMVLYSVIIPGSLAPLKRGELAPTIIFVSVAVVVVRMLFDRR